MKRKARVLICDDHPVVRTKVRQLVGQWADFEVVGEAAAGAEGVRLARDLQADVVVMDVAMPGMDGLEATRKIVAQSPAVRVVMFSTTTDNAVVPQAFSAGAAGYLLKDAPGEEIRAALRAVLAGEKYVSPQMKTSPPPPLKEQVAHVGATRCATPPAVFRVLLVDDSAVVRERLAAALSALDGVQIVGQAGDVPEGLRLVAETKPDLLVLDIGLPGESGLTLLETVKRQQPAPITIMLTNQDHPKLRQHCAALGADFYFHKPTEFERVIDLCFHLAQTPPAAGPRLGQAADSGSEPAQLAVALQASQERYQQFIQLTTEGLARYEAATPVAVDLPPEQQAVALLELARVVECNEAFARHYGLAQATDAVGLRLEDVMAGTRAEKLQRVQQFIAAQYRLVDFEAPDVTRDGRVVWMRNSVVGVVEQGQLTRVWVLQQDITQRRQIEERLREQAHMLDLAHDAIVIRDLDDRVTYWNGSAQALYGWAAEEVLGRPLKEILPEDTTTSLAVRQAVWEQDQWQGEVKLHNRAGEEIVVESRLTLIRDRQGNPKSLLAINTNITERKRLETQFLRAQRLESIGALAGGISHDLNNILAPIIMSCQMLQLEVQQAEHRKLLDIILASAKRGADLVKQVLAFYRGGATTRQELALPDLLKELRQILAETFPKSVQLDLRAAPNLARVAGDPTQLHQVLLNLAVNARDAMPQGGQLTITAENVFVPNPLAVGGDATKPRAHVLLTVTDTGTGIDPALTRKIFEPLFTTKPPGVGTGLGLSTSLAIVKNHGGFMNVRSEPGKGASFQVYLPACESSVPPVVLPDAMQIPRGNGELILVVDDEASVRLLMAQVLQTFGYRTTLARSGAEAVEMYRERHREVAAVVVDLFMPGMDGRTTISKLGEINPRLRVLAASGGDEKQQAALMPGGFVKAFLAKPYSAGTLLKLLRQVLGGGEMGDVGAVGSAL